MVSYWMTSEVGKARYADMLRDGAAARRFLTAKHSRKLSMFWQYVILLFS